MSLFRHLFAEPKPPHDLVRPNPRLGMIRFSRAIFLLMTVLFFVLFLFLIIANSLVNARVTFGPRSFPWPFLFLILISLFNVSVLSLQIHSWKRVEAWRFAAALGEKRLLADEQPEPNAEALQIPMTIRMSPLIERRIFMGYGLFAIFLITGDLSLSLTLLLSSPLPWFWSMLIAVLVGGLLTLGFLLLTQIRSPIEVSQEGIRFRTPERISTFLFWHEARLFACYPEPGPWSESPTMIYELSSAIHVVYWTWMQSKHPLNFIAGSSLPFEEHNAQMRALCSLITAKTGLPLYDLSKGQTRKWEDVSVKQQGM